MIGRVLGFTAALALCGATALAQKLSPGDAAPELSIAKWFKGEPVKTLEKDKTYVVEFWATWCGPCVRGMPHLTELQKEHGDTVKFIGVNIWDRKKDRQTGEFSESVEEQIERVADFVEKQGDKMGYTVAIEDGEKMAENWMKPAGQTGIPCAFIVSGGKVQWIGHPMAMDEPLKKVLAGEFDVGAAAEAAARQARLDERRARLQEQAEELMGEAEEAFGNDDMETVLTKMDEVIALDAEVFGEMVIGKYSFIASQMGDQERADTYAAGPGMEVIKDNAQLLNHLAWLILTDAKAFGGEPDAAVALKIAKRANALAEGKDASILDTLAKACWETGDKEGAVKWQKAAIENASSDEEADVYRETLATYEKD